MLNQARANEIREASLKDLPKLWTLLSEDLDSHHRLYPYRYDKSAASRAKKWLLAAFHDTDDSATTEQYRPIELALRLPVDEAAESARSAFHQSNPGKSEKSLRRGGDEVARSARRALRFFHLWLGEDSRICSEQSEWPDPPMGGSRSKGYTLYRHIRRFLIAEGKYSPTNVTPNDILRAAHKYRQKADEEKRYRTWNQMVRGLKKAVENQDIPGLEPKLFSKLEEVKCNRGPESWEALSDSRLSELWPAEFQLNARSRNLSLCFGLLAFFNAELGPERPKNLGGKLCERKNLLSPRSLRNRITTIKRYLYFILEHMIVEASDLRSLFTPEYIYKYVKYVEGKNARSTSYPATEFNHLCQTAKRYYDYDTKGLEEDIEELELPPPGSSSKGKRVLREVKSPGNILKWIDAFLMYAELVPRPKKAAGSPGVGYFFPRISHGISLVIQCVSGIRPGNTELITYSETIPDNPSGCVLWKEPEGHYKLFIEAQFMKQNKSRKINDVGRFRVGDGFEFRVAYPKAVQMLDLYLNEAWPYAKSVKEGSTQKLLIDAKGEPFSGSIDAASKSFSIMKRHVKQHYRKITGEELPDIDRYAHRHVIGEFLERYDPGRNLKTRFLTHRERGTRSDQAYGDHDPSYLQDRVHEVLDGKPPLHKQEEIRRNEADLRDNENRKLLEKLHTEMRLQTEMNELLYEELRMKEKKIYELQLKLVHTPLESCD